jgi:hypothetical protein
VKRLLDGLSVVFVLAEPGVFSRPGRIFRQRTNLRGMAHPLRKRNFRLLFTGRIVDALGDAVSPAALTLAIIIATRSSAGLALVLTCALLPKVALLPSAEWSWTGCGRGASPWRPPRCPAGPSCSSACC